MDNKKLSVFFSKSWIFDFCFDYADKHRENFTKKQLLKRDIYSAFISFVNNKNAAFVFDLKKNEKDYITRQLKANIGRNLWGNEIFYSILLKEDRFVEKAKELF